MRPEGLMAERNSVGASFMIDSVKIANGADRSFDKADPSDVVKRRQRMHRLITRIDRPEDTPLQDDGEQTIRTPSKQSMKSAGTADIENRSNVMSARNNFTRNAGRGPSATEEEVRPYNHGFPHPLAQTSISRVNSAMVDFIPTNDPPRMQSMTETFGDQNEGMNIYAGGTVYVPNRPAGSKVWPVESDKSHITSVFGHRERPKKGASENHGGIDVGEIGLLPGARSGPFIRACMAGVVVESRFSRGYGNLVSIDHPGGLSTRYAHGESRLVGVGEHVEAGHRIMVMGTTGTSTGVHLHFEVIHNGKKINPESFLTGVPRRRKI